MHSGHSHKSFTILSNSHPRICTFRVPERCCSRVRGVFLENQHSLLTTGSAHVCHFLLSLVSRLRVMISHYHSVNAFYCLPLYSKYNCGRFFFAVFSISWRSILVCINVTVYNHCYFTFIIVNTISKGLQKNTVKRGTDQKEKQDIRYMSQFTISLTKENSDDTHGSWIAWSTNKPHKSLQRSQVANLKAKYFVEKTFASA